jgi:hypothetical protein
MWIDGTPLTLSQVFGSVYDFAGRRWPQKLGAVLMSGHIFKIGFASQTNLKKQKNGWQKNSDETTSGLHFSARHFSAVPFRFRVFTNVS